MAIFFRFLPCSMPYWKIDAILPLFWRRQWHPTPVLLPRKSHGRRSLVGCSPWGRKESDTTEGLHFHFSLSCIGEGNGNPLQYSCLESPRDGGAWWAAVYGVAQSRTWLKRHSSSSSIYKRHKDLKLIDKNLPAYQNYRIINFYGYKLTCHFLKCHCWTT